MEHKENKSFDELDMDTEGRFCDSPMGSPSFIDVLYETDPLFVLVPSDTLKLDIEDLPIIEPDSVQSDKASTAVSEGTSEYYDKQPSKSLSQENLYQDKEIPDFTIKRIGSLTLEERHLKVQRYLDKRQRRTWNKRINYDCRKRVADKRIRVKGRFVTKEQACLLLEEQKQMNAQMQIENNSPCQASLN
mmetsp:Transcript_22050/g.21747  ORF Transcript_22050/g.21747 Transcript_22050/m.21747 type:complete len:189 (+) Transcript_22050:16-582(+)